MSFYFIVIYSILIFAPFGSGSGSGSGSGGGGGGSGSASASSGSSSSNSSNVIFQQIYNVYILIKYDTCDITRDGCQGSA